MQLGDEVEVMILEIDEDRRRISLGMKQCMSNPWDDFAINHKKGDKVRGQIKSLTDFGVFIGLEGGIDGLVHLSDLSWSLTGEEAVRQYKKGDEVEAVVLNIDVEKERISLGIKQLEGDPFTNFIATLSLLLKVGESVEALIINVDRKTRGINLSIRAKDQVEQNEAMSKLASDSGSAASGTTNLGALLKAKLNEQK